MMSCGSQVERGEEWKKRVEDVEQGKEGKGGRDV